MIAKLHTSLQARWDALDRNARGAMLVSLGSFTLVVMAIIVASSLYLVLTERRRI